jgi:hypothetical protein
MSNGALNPLIHDPWRLRIVATLAALPDGDALSVKRLPRSAGSMGRVLPDRFKITAHPHRRNPRHASGPINGRRNPGQFTVAGTS